MREHGARNPERGGDSVAAAWLRALELTSRLAQQPNRTFPIVIDELAAQFQEAPALISESECLSYSGLARRVNQYARWALGQNLSREDCVCLLMANRPEYMPVWLGVSKIGAVVALLNTNLRGHSLAHCIRLVSPKHIIAATEFLQPLTEALTAVASKPTVWAHGSHSASARRIDLELERYPGERLSERERRLVTIEDPALYLYTSGTSGLPKAVNFTHGRVMQWSHWFSGMMNTRPTERMYNCLPLYHGVGGVQALGAMLVGGGSVVVRSRFSVSQFWDDVVRWDCTLFQYIGELCRYLLDSEPSPLEKRHHLRMACGNGLRPDIWRDFQRRFQIPQILEFYGASEGSVSLFNVEGEPGSLGRFPPYLAHRFRATLVRIDVEKQEPLRDEQGFCIPCVTDEVGEAIGPLLTGPANIANRFEGYTDHVASEEKILHHVFEPGDAWFRTGDLMRKDRRGFFYFVDRLGDTFRWKGENVATSEVDEAISSFPGVRQANVYGVEIPGTDGRAGMAVLILDHKLNLSALRAHLVGCLPRYACPLFLRVRDEMEVTSTFRPKKADLVREGYNPAATADAIYFNHPTHKVFVRLDQALYEEIQTGRIRL